MTSRTWTRAALCVSAWLALTLASPALLGRPAVQRSAADETKDLKVFVEAFSARERFNGTILVQRGAQELFRANFGLADRIWGTPATDRTRYRIASVTKTFTAVLVLRLADQGRLDLFQTVGHYLADYKGPARDRVTVRQLLNHTSGIRNLDASISSKDGAIRDGVEHYQRPLTSDALVEHYCAGPLVSEPGQKFSYNNCDYILLGKIVERLHKQPYEMVLQNEILNPVALADTGFLRQWEIVDRLAGTYITRTGVNGLTHDLPVYWENWYAAGAMYSTVDDLMRFSKALFDGKLLGPSSLDQMLTPGLDRYGYGIWVREEDIAGRKWKSTLRPGSIMGANAAWYHVLEPGLTVIALSNTDEPNLDQFVYGVGRLLIR